MDFKKHKVLFRDLIKDFDKDFRVIEVVKDIKQTILTCQKEIER